MGGGHPCQQLGDEQYLGDNANAQSARQDRFSLINRKQMMRLQLHVRLPTPQFAKGVYNQSMAGYRSGNSDAKRTSFAMGYSLGTNLCLIDVVQDASGIAQK